MAGTLFSVVLPQRPLFEAVHLPFGNAQEQPDVPAGILPAASDFVPLALSWALHTSLLVCIFLAAMSLSSELLCQEVPHVTPGFV